MVGLDKIKLLKKTGSTYGTKKDSEKAELLRKVESYLFLNIPQLERQGADIRVR
jgi:hypothetical protein